MIARKLLKSPDNPAGPSLQELLRHLSLEIQGQMLLLPAGPRRGVAKQVVGHLIAAEGLCEAAFGEDEDIGSRQRLATAR